MKLLKYIRHRICRTIYYADQCPMDNRRNYRALAALAAQGALVFVVSFIAMFIFVLMSI